MRADYTELVVLLDRSGSMELGRSDHEGGLRSFIRDQRQLAGDVRLTFVRFDSVEAFELVYDGTPLANVSDLKLTLTPRGSTPLLAAVVRTLAHVKDRLEKSEKKPDQVVVLIITDGQENASGPEYSCEKVKKAVLDSEAAGWKILYLGANVDAFSEAGSLGIGSHSALGYAVAGPAIASAYASVSNNMNAARNLIQTSGISATVGEAGAEQVYANYNFTKAQRDSAKPGENKDDTEQQSTAGVPNQ